MTEPSSTGPGGDELPATAWVTVAAAAEKSGVGTSTVRQWYRSGRLPTQRAEGERGAFLVPLDLVMALADQADGEGDALAAEVIDLNASYWSAQTETAREEATAARNELAAARTQLQATQDQVAFLRSQLVEAADEARRLRDEAEATPAELQRERHREPVVVEAPTDDAAEALRAELDAVREDLARVRSELTEVRDELDRTGLERDRTEGRLEVTENQLTRTEAELAKLKEISSAVGSITDNSWLDLPTNAYRSPVRPQGMAAAAAGLSGLLAATQPDADAAAAAEAERAAVAWRADDDDEPEMTGPAPDPESEGALSAAPALPHHQLGHHDDDLLPRPEKKGRRGRR